MASPPDPLFTEYMTCLKDVYKDPPRPWGPLPECELIKLAMIKEERWGGPDDRTDLHEITISVDKKLARKSPVDIDELFNVGTFDNDRKVILVEGEPGMGKTMLAHHYCQKWAAGELSMFDAVILVLLRELDVESDSSLANLLVIASAEHVVETTNKMAENVTSLLKNMKSLFIFDGWDEFPAACKDQKRSCVQRIINKPQSVSPQTTILITSRPDSSLDLHKVANRVEILGFTEDNVHKYFRKALQHKLSSDKVESGFSKLRSHLDDYSAIKSSCYVPLNTAILVDLFCECGQALPKTRYELFQELVLYCINRERETRSNVRNVEGVSSLEDPNVKDQLSHICKLAYEGVMKTKAVFKQKEVLAYNLPTQISTLGLLQRVEHFVHSCRTVSYHFLHLSFQELLAAHHISQMEEGEQVKVFESLLGEPRFSAVLQFYAAITKLTNQGVRNIITGKEFLLEDHRGRHRHLLLLLNCLFEAQLQDQSLYHQIISNLNSELDLQFTPLSPVDCMSVGYLLASILPMPTGELTVNLKMCMLTAHSMSLLLGELSRHPDTSAGVLALQGIVSLDIGINNIGGSAIAQIARALSRNSTLQKLGICYCGITEVGVESLADALATSRSLQELDISGNKIGDNGLVHIATALKRSLTLNISRCGITEVGVKSFVETLTTNNSLQQLCLDHWQLKMGLERNGSLTEVVIEQHGLPTEGVVSVAEVIIANNPLQELTIRHVDIGDSGVAGIATAVRKCKTLKKLMIVECGITEVGVESLVETLTANSSLQQLFLSDDQLMLRNGTFTEVVINQDGLSTEEVVSIETLIANNPLYKLTIRYVDIGDSGIAAIATALKKGNTLKKLDIFECGITEVGVESLAEALAVNSSLNKLIISGKDIGDNGMAHIAKAFERNSTLEKLDINGWGILTKVGVESLAQALALNRSLKKLIVSCDNIVDKGIIHIAKALDRNGILEKPGISQYRGVSRWWGSLFPRQHLSRETRWGILTEVGVKSLAAALSAAFAVNSPLKKLIISRNYIGDNGIAYVLEWNRTLEKLDVNITEVGVESLAQTLGVNSSLTKLFVRGNNIGDNGLVHIAEALERNSTLEELDISRCGITEVGVKSFVEILTTNSLLQQLLILSSWHLKMGLERNGTLTEVAIEEHSLSMEGVVSVAETLIANNPLQELTIRDVDIGDSGIAGIATAVKKFNTLKKLSITRCDITEVGVESLVQTLAVNSSLKKVILSGNNIGDNGIAHVAKALERNSTLEELDISGCGITEVGVKSFVEILTTNSSLQQLFLEGWHLRMGLERNGTLTEVAIGEHGVSMEGVVSVAETLIANNPLQELTIRYVDIGDSGIAGIVTALKKFNTLKKLGISWCDITEVGVESLAQTLAVNSSLKKVIVSGNNIWDNGIVHIAKAIERNSTLEELDISGCGITEVGVESLVETLTANSSIQQLCVNHCELKMCLERNGTLTKVVLNRHGSSTKGVVSVAETLIANNPLQELTIRYVHIGDSGIAGIATALKKFNTLEELSITRCDITEVGVESLAEALAINHSLEKLVLGWSSTHSDQTMRKLAECVKRSALKELHLSPLPGAECVKRSALKELHLSPLPGTLKKLYLSPLAAEQLEIVEFLQSLETGGKEFIQSQEDGDLRKFTLELGTDYTRTCTSWYEISQVHESLKASVSLVNSARREKGRPPIDVVFRMI